MHAFTWTKRQSPSGELSALELACRVGSRGLPSRLDIQLIKRIQRQIEKLMLVLPPHILLLELLGLRAWLRRRLGDLGDEVGRRRFGYTVDENTKQRDLKDDEESDGETVQHAFPIMKPQLLLLLRVANAAEVRFKLSRNQYLSNTVD